MQPSVRRTRQTRPPRWTPRSSPATAASPDQLTGLEQPARWPNAMPPVAAYVWPALRSPCPASAAARRRVRDLRQAIKPGHLDRLRPMQVMIVVTERCTPEEPVDEYNCRTHGQQPACLMSLESGFLPIVPCHAISWTHFVPYLATQAMCCQPSA